MGFFSYDGLGNFTLKAQTLPWKGPFLVQPNITYLTFSDRWNRIRSLKLRNTLKKSPWVCQAGLSTHLRSYNCTCTSGVHVLPWDGPKCEHFFHEHLTWAGKRGSECTWFGIWFSTPHSVKHFFPGCWRLPITIHVQMPKGPCPRLASSAFVLEL